MVPLTRRRLLHGATAVAVTLSGCNGASSGSSSGSSSSNVPSDAENVEVDPESYALRTSGDDPLAWIGTLPTETETPHGEERRITDAETGLIASDDGVADLTFGDVDGRVEAQSFVEATDFDAETLLLTTDVVGECYHLDLCAVTWTDDSYHTYFGRTLRPAEVACETDARDRIAHLVRIPDTLDPDEITGRGSGTTSRSCATFRQRFERERASGSDR